MTKKDFVVFADMYIKLFEQSARLEWDTYDVIKALKEDLKKACAECGDSFSPSMFDSYIDKKIKEGEVV